MAAPTLASVKQWLGIASTSDDALIQGCLDSAIQTVAEHTGTIIGTGQTDWRRVRLGETRIDLVAKTYGEFEGITELHIRGVNSDGAAVTLTTSTGYTTMRNSWELIVRITSDVWDDFEAASQGGAAIDTLLPVQISFTAGMAAADVPADWALCISQLAAEAYQNRGDMPSRKRVSEVYLSRISPRR